MTELLMVDSTPSVFGLRFITTYVLRIGDKLVVVDPGPVVTVECLVRKILELHPRSVEVVLTHVHIDHAGNTGHLVHSLRARGVEVRVWVHPRGARHIRDPSRLWEASLAVLGETARIYGELLPVPREAVHETRDGEELVLDGARLVFVHSPGHASHHQSILAVVGGSRVLFTGDSAGIYVPETGGLVPTTPPPFHPDKYMESLEKMVALKSSRLAFTHTGVGPASLLEAHREQIMLWLALAEEAVAEDTELREFLEKVLARDQLARRAYSYLSKSSYTLQAMLHTAQGVMEAVREKGVR
ncbi:MBL fold metallo-hydrolase [Hyperthermus butylicus]|uniref:Zn-dependent hydrolase n=1 Tax=Hyperthermus butylicus (strain DSM 5456 / JCM 9403 / PLM1-5) TaxID=415426 RepID=A2BJN1_HYPBU|nr:MBL fold metallo-hydrolase [Hyperthermus butylicus]ABM80192.1 Zn-dependent hydrolase [Hyperthermus butylicus DSM 5456]